MSGREDDDPAVRAWRLLQALVFDNDRRKDVADALGITFSRARLLRRLADGPKTMGELAELLGTDPPYVTVIVDDLEARGLLCRRAHPKDRRVRLVELTGRGAAATAKASEIMARPPAALVALGAEQLSQLCELLSALTTSPEQELAVRRGEGA